MKKLITHLFFCFTLLSTLQVSAQYCGSSQVSFPSCGIQQNSGFGNIDSFKCITRGQYDSIIIPFKVYTGFTAQGNTVTIYKLKIDEIDSLPCGLCWSTSQSSLSINGVPNGPNEFSPAESACLKISGLTNRPAGSYKLSMILNVRTQSTSTGWDVDSIPSDAGGIVLWIKVIDPGANCPMTVDMAHPQEPLCPLGITEVSKNFTNLIVQPNPMSNEATISFNSEISGTQQIRITNIVRSEVYSGTLNVKNGSNETTIKRNNLPAGIYILSIGGNQGMVSRKFIIAD